MTYQENKDILILGASGLIGRYLFNLLKKEEKVIGTYANNKKEGLFHFDITKDSVQNLPIKGTGYCIICSAITKLDECKERPDYSREINVRGIEKIMIDLKKRDILPIFISSAAVFDGIRGWYKEEDEKNPISTYGGQKAEVEDFINENLQDFLIIRPGKVFGVKEGEGVLFTKWFEQYKKKEKIFCADDEELSPNYVEDVARAIKKLLKTGSKGIYHINPPEHYSRYEMAKKFFDYLGIEYTQLIRCSLDNLNFLEGKRAKKTFLDSSKFIRETQFRFTTLEKCFETIRHN